MIVNEYDEKEFFDKSIKMLEKDYGNNFANDFKEIYIKQQKEIKRLNGIIQIKQERINKLNKKIIRRDNIIEDLKAILKSKGYETYIPRLERSDKK